MQKAVNAEAKASLKSSSIVRDLDICCPRNHRPSNNTTSKVQTQETTTKKPHSKESRPNEAKLAKRNVSVLLRTNAAESLEQGKKDRKNKKQKFQERRELKETPTTGDNAINIFKKDSKKSVISVKSRTLTAIRKATMLASVPSLQKTSIGLGNFHAGN